MEKNLLRFGASIGRLVYTQKHVELITGVSVSDQNSWRKRGFVSADETGVRVRYPGETLLRLALIDQLAWAIGPQRGTDAADYLRTYIQDYGAACCKGDTSRFDRNVLYADKPQDAYKTAFTFMKDAEPSDPDDEDSFGIGFYIRSEGFESLAVGGDAKLVVPIGYRFGVVASTAARFLTEQGKIK